MTKSQWQEIENVFNSAIKVSSDERFTYLKNTCGENADLFEEVSKLLAEDSKNDNFLEDSVVEIGYNLLTKNKSGITLLEGQKIGSYKILRFLGNGGMGAVYLAKDTELNRNVALKILVPAFTSSNDINRFKQEARAASAVNHPSIAHIYEYNFIDDRYFIAMEYIEGKTLRQLLKEELDSQQVIEIGLQIANALSAAHSLGIIHRDIKPENIIVRDDKVVKILDFGIAKLVDETQSGNSQNTKDNQSILIGTPYYMSPEQIRGEVADHRADIWSLGVVLYEMILQRRPFYGNSTTETIHAVLTENVKDFDKLEKKTNSNLVKVIRRCLSKKPEHRFQTAQDLAFSLESLITSYSGKFFNPNNQIYQKKYFWFGIICFLALLIVSAFALTTNIFKNDSDFGLPKAELPIFQQQTFQRGTIWNARYSPDDNSIVYDASWNGKNIDIFTTKINSPESKQFNLPNTYLLSISSKGEMAVLLPKQYIYQFIQQGTLARMPVNGTTPREIAENVQEADWSPDGTNLAISRVSPTGNQLEYPIGKVLFQTTGYISSLRVSPKNDFVAFLEHPKQKDNRGYVSIVDNIGNKRTLTDEFSGIEGLAWNPKTGEIWFTASKNGEAYSLYAATISGKTRLISRVPINLMLYDISPNGQVLLSRSYQFTNIYGSKIGDGTEQNLSWLYLVGISDLSKDGKEFLLTHFGEGSGINYEVFLRNTDGSEPIRLGEGRALSLSPDGKFALAKLNVPEQLNIIPTKAGEPQILPRGNIEKYDNACWFPDKENILFTGNAVGEGKRTFIQNLSSGEIKPLTPIGVTGNLISPNGKTIVVNNSEGEKMLFHIENSSLEAIKGLDTNDEVMNWSEDNKSLFIFKSTVMPIKAYQLELKTGKKELLTTINPSNQIGVFGKPYLFITPDAKYYLYGLRRYLFDLYTVDNL